MHDPQPWRTRLAQAIGQLQIGLGFGQTLQRRHLGAHQRPVHQEIAQRFQPRIVAGLLQPGVEHAPGQIGPFAVQQVHHQKGHVGHHVHPAEGRRELDGVERHRLAIQQHQIAQMQIAMAFADPALLPALVKQRRQSRTFAPRPAQQALQRGALGRAVQTATQGAKVVGSSMANRQRITMGRAGLRDLGHGMHLRHLQRQRIELFRLQRIARHQRGQQAVLGKAAHLHRVIDHLARAAPDRLLRRAGDRDDGLVQFRRGTAVQAQFFLAALAAQRQRAVVQKTQVQRLAQLVGAFASQQNPGDMRLQAFDRFLRVLQLQLLLQALHHLLRRGQIHLLHHAASGRRRSSVTCIGRTNCAPSGPCCAANRACS